MLPPTIIKFMAVGAIVVSVVGGLGFRQRGDDPTSAAPASLGQFEHRATTASAISFFADRVAAHPGDALSATILSELHMRRGRETSDIGEYALAVESAQLALARLPEHAPAHLALARAQFALHQFDEAAESASVATSLDSTLGAEVVIADVAVAIGDLSRAEKIYQKLDSTFDSPALDARIAHVAELKGEYPKAIAIMTAARSDAARLDYAGEAAAWFELRLGDLAFATGDYRAAERHYTDSLHLFERYPPALAGVARSRAAQGRFEQAAGSYEQSIALQPTPEVLLSAARMYEHLGRSEAAHEHRSTLDLVARLSNGVFDIAYIHHLVDVGRASEALEIARRQAIDRADPYTLDALARAAYEAGDQAVARASIDRALAFGSSDPRLLAHAGLIYLEVDPGEAAVLLERALQLSPEFDPLEAATARAALDKVRRP